VKDKIALYRETLGMSHLVVTRLRVEGVPSDGLRESVTAIAGLV